MGRKLGWRGSEHLPNWEARCKANIALVAVRGSGRAGRSWPKVVGRICLGGLWHRLRLDL